MEKEYKDTPKCTSGILWQSQARWHLVAKPGKIPAENPMRMKYALLLTLPSFDDHVNLHACLCCAVACQGSLRIFQSGKCCFALGVLECLQSLLFLTRSTEMTKLAIFLVLAASRVEKGARPAATFVVQQGTNAGKLCASKLWWCYGL